jgi:aspartyl-tRNA synthetase
MEKYLESILKKEFPKISVESIIIPEYSILNKDKIKKSITYIKENNLIKLAYEKIEGDSKIDSIIYNLNNSEKDDLKFKLQKVNNSNIYIAFIIKENEYVHREIQARMYNIDLD